MRRKKSRSRRCVQVKTNVARDIGRIGMGLKKIYTEKEVKGEKKMI